MNADVIVEGVSDGDLRQGPGHYPGTPLPGEVGNAAIAGHRTTYAAPFYNLNQLQIGDPIVVQTLAGTFHYAVSESTIVAPSDSAVLDASTTPELTLTTCNPRYSASQRLVVVATLQSSQPAVVAAATPPVRHHRTAKAEASQLTQLDGGGGGSGITGVVLWGLLAAVVALIGAMAWRRSKRPWPRWVTVAIGTPGFLVALFVFYGHLSTLLPASF
jgi:sortase A